MCSTCRKPRTYRKPSIITPPAGTTVAPGNGRAQSGISGSGDQRSRITGLTYAPKK